MSVTAAVVVEHLMIVGVGTDNLMIVDVAIDHLMIVDVVVDPVLILAIEMVVDSMMAFNQVHHHLHMVDVLDHRREGAVIVVDIVPVIVARRLDAVVGMETVVGTMMTIASTKSANNMIAV